jgi:hypothetical protein
MGRCNVVTFYVLREVSDYFLELSTSEPNCDPDGPSFWNISSSRHSATCPGIGIGPSLAVQDAGETLTAS